MPERFRRSVPWTLGDLMILYACTFVGLLLVGIAWYGASSSVAVSAQVRWANLAVGGLILLGAGQLAWLLTGRRAVGELRRHVLRQARSDAVVEQAPVAHAAENGRFVAAKNMTRYHRPACLLVAGKKVEAGAETKLQKRGLRPCGVCLEPDEPAA
jgi:hypothetical protein